MIGSRQAGALQPQIEFVSTEDIDNLVQVLAHEGFTAREKHDAAADRANVARNRVDFLKRYFVQRGVGLHDVALATLQVATPGNIELDVIGRALRN